MLTQLHITVRVGSSKDPENEASRNLIFERVATFTYLSLTSVTLDWSPVLTHAFAGLLIVNQGTFRTGHDVTRLSILQPISFQPK